jgi:LuxR family maltose regulon positive regulatory protein
MMMQVTPNLQDQVHWRSRMSSFGDDAPTLIQTNLHRPRLGQDLISRPHLIRRLNQGVDRKLTFISAQAGSGKSTLLAQWLEQCPRQSAWLSLDENDNSLMVFVSYLCAAIQTVFPDACEHALDLLNAPVTPPSRILMASLVNELAVLCNSSHASDEGGNGASGLIIAFDDYHTIKEPTIHELLSELIAYLPQCVHLALSTRTDPPLPLAGLRARWEMTELRTNDLQLSTEEASALLELTAGRKLSHDTVDLLRDKSEGWMVGLRLAALSIRDLPDDRNFTEQLERAGGSIIADYLLKEILSQQPPEYQEFMLRSSILERFCSDLCDAVLRFEDDPSFEPQRSRSVQSQTILSGLRSANLFLLQLDPEGRWFRYHHLLRDLLRHQLKSRYRAEYIRALHGRASKWFEQNDLIDEALNHAFLAEDMDRAAQIVERQRYKLLNQTRWQRLDRYLHRFPSNYIRRSPGLLMLKSWLINHQGNYGQLPAALQQLSVAMDEAVLPSGTIGHLKGEISALRSLIHYFQRNAAAVIREAEFSIKHTAPELWIVRIHARLYLGGAYQYKGELDRAYEAYYRGLDEEDIQTNRFKAILFMTSCHIHWIAADLLGMRNSAVQCIALCDFPHSAQIKGFGQYHLGRVHYERNELLEAEKSLYAVVQKPYVNYGVAYADSAFCLGMLYQAQNRQVAAREIASSVVAHMMETGNTTLLSVAQAFQAEIALRQGQLAEAKQWADQFKSVPPILPMSRLYEPNFTFVRLWLAQNTSDSHQRALEFLEELRSFTRMTGNTVSLIQVLAWQAVQSAAQDDEPTALDLLREALELAQPGGFIRIIVDIGHPIDRLLYSLKERGAFPAYIGKILAAFPKATGVEKPLTSSADQQTLASMVVALTPREMDVLELLARRLTNKEIAQKLMVSPDTVKTHTLSIYAKLDVHGRRQAVDKAREIGLLSPT